MKRLLVALLLTLSAVVLIFMRHPMVDDVFCDPDVAGAAYSAQELLRGGDLYGDTVETKPPFTYLLMAFLFSRFGLTMSPVYIAAIIVHLVMLLCLFWLGRSILGDLAGLLAALLYALYSVTTAVNGWCPNFETWPLAPLGLGFVLLWRQMQTRRWWQPVLIGLCGGWAVLGKQNVAVFGLAWLALLWLAQPETKSRNERLRGFAGDTLLALFGLALPLAATALYFAQRGGLASLLSALHPQAVVEYVSSERLGFNARGLLHNGGKLLLYTKFLFLPMIGLFALIFWEKWRREVDAKIVRGLQFIEIWLIGAILAVVAGTKFFSHYFVLLMPPVTLAAGFVVHLLGFRIWKKTVAGVVLVGVLLAGALVDMRLEISIAAKALNDRLQRGQVYWQEGDDYFWRRAGLPRYSAWSYLLRDVGRCLDSHARPGETIYVWDYEPGVYWYAQRRAPTRHFMYFNVATSLPDNAGRWFGEEDPFVRAQREQLLNDLTRSPPAYVVVLTHREPKNWWDYSHVPAPMFDPLRRFVDEQYQRDDDCSNRYLTTLRRVDPD